MRELMNKSKVLFEFARDKITINDVEVSDIRGKHLVLKCDEVV